MSDRAPIAPAPPLATDYAAPDFARHLAGLAQRRGIQAAKLPGGHVPARGPVDAAPEPTLPALAWVCALRAGGAVTLRHGPAVETLPGAVVEGVWDGPFTLAALRASGLRTASGVAFDPDGPTFLPARNAHDPLWVLHAEGPRATFVSNSAVAVLEAAGLPGDHPFARGVAETIVDRSHEANVAGCDHHDPLVRTGDGHRLHRMMLYDFAVDHAGRFRVDPCPPDPSPADFAGYRAMLAGATARTLANAADPARRRRLDPVAPISNGYDSPAVAVLGAEAGLRETVTLDVVANGVTDRGDAIARALGLDCHVVAHRHGREPIGRQAPLDPDALEDHAEFLATQGIGDDVAFLTMAPHLEGRCVLLGTMGDSVWNRRARLAPGLPVRSFFGRSHGEFRLRIGAAFVPVPAFGARWPAPISALSDAPEMAPWQVGGPYDRPIPRRIVEEAGVPRGAFGVRKAAAHPLIADHRARKAEAIALIRRRYAAIRDLGADAATAPAARPPGPAARLLARLRG